MIPTAIYDLTGPHLVIRCPHCNCFDRSLEFAKPGIYQCDECLKEFYFGGMPQ